MRTRLTCLCLLFIVNATAREPSSLNLGIGSVDAYASYLASNDFFSGVIVIEQHQRRLYAKAFGLADRNAQTPVTMTTPFSIASQGRMFAAVAVLQLVEAGKVNLDDPVGNYVPDYPNRDVADNETIRFLLTHWGGPVDGRILEPDAIDTRDRARARPNLTWSRGRGTTPVCLPGPIEDCSKYGLTLLRDVIQRVTGQSYNDYVEQHIFRPAGMTQTRYPTKGQASGAAIGYTHINDLKHPSEAVLPSRGVPMSAGISTADDEIRFLNALNDGTLISKQSLAEATNRKTPWYGYAWGSATPASATEIPHWGHGGWVDGNSMVLLYYPTLDLTVVCLSNRDPPVCDDVLSRLHASLAEPEPN